MPSLGFLKVSKDLHKSICEEYQRGIFAKDLALKYKVSKTTIRGIIKNNGAFSGKRRHRCDDGFFDRIDTESKSYILGFLYADGYNDEARHRINIGLSRVDLDIITKIGSCLSYTGKVCYYSAKGKLYCSIGISSHRLSNKLHNLGCFQRKSLTLRFPTSDQIPDHLLRHFIRGYFDGDGSLSIRTNGVCSVSILSTPSFISDMRVKLKSHINEIGSVSIHQNQKSLYFYLSGGRQINKFLDWIYKDATIYLDRKHQKYIEFKVLRSQMKGRWGTGILAKGGLNLPGLALQKQTYERTVDVLLQGLHS